MIKYEPYKDSALYYKILLNNITDYKLHRHDNNEKNVNIIRNYLKIIQKEIEFKMISFKNFHYDQK